MTNYEVATLLIGILSLLSLSISINTKINLNKSKKHKLLQKGLVNTAYQDSKIINNYGIKIEELDDRLEELEKTVLGKASDQSFIDSIMFGG